MPSWCTPPYRFLHDLLNKPLTVKLFCRILKTKEIICKIFKTLELWFALELSEDTSLRLADSVSTLVSILSAGRYRGCDPDHVPRVLVVQRSGGRGEWTSRRQ